MQQLIISNDTRLPHTIIDDINNATIWNLDTFLEKVSDEENPFEMAKGEILFHISCLDAELYSALQDFLTELDEDEDIDVILYRFEDETDDLDFEVFEDIKIIRNKPTTVQEEQVVPLSTQPTIPSSQQPQLQNTQAQSPQAYNSTISPQLSQPVVQSQQPHILNQYSQQSYMVPNMPQQQNIQQPPQNMMTTQPHHEIISDFSGVNNTSTNNMYQYKNMQHLENILNYDDVNSATTFNNNIDARHGKVIVFGSSKGGTGKTFTSLITAYRYAEAHPHLKIAFADFDILDGQIATILNTFSPTLMDYYGMYKQGFNKFDFLYNYKIKHKHFNQNIDFYLAPPTEVDEMTNNNAFWHDTLKMLVTNYDIVFFDSGTEYLKIKPISFLYKIADKIILTTNPSINSVKSLIRQCNHLSGNFNNNIFKADDNILSKVKIVLTRVYDDVEINNLVINTLSQYAQVIALFGNIDDVVSQVQWYQNWSVISQNETIVRYLDKIGEV